jgi:hypothetical protein
MIVRLASAILAAAGIALAIAPPAIADTNSYLAELLKAGLYFPPDTQLADVLNAANWPPPDDADAKLREVVKNANHDGEWICRELEYATMTVREIESAVWDAPRSFGEDGARTLVNIAASNLCRDKLGNVTGTGAEDAQDQELEDDDD